MQSTRQRTRKPSLDDYRLYFVTDPYLNKGYTVIDQVRLVLKGGVRVIQIREKGQSVAGTAVLVSRALELTRMASAFLIVNDSLEVASAMGADGVHLGQDDIPAKDVRKTMGPHFIIGLSVKTVEEAVQGEKDGADYLAVNGVFPTMTKQDLGYCPGLQGVAEIRRNTSIPIIGIGGINLNNCRAVIDAGAHGIAVVTALTMAEDIPSSCKSFFEQFETPSSL